jgi:hypothetical protein
MHILTMAMYCKLFKKKRYLLYLEILQVNFAVFFFKSTTKIRLTQLVAETQRQPILTVALTSSQITSTQVPLVMDVITLINLFTRHATISQTIIVICQVLVLA